jgi:hypothetical protein
LALATVERFLSPEPDAAAFRPINTLYFDVFPQSNVEMSYEKRFVLDAFRPIESTHPLSRCFRHRESPVVSRRGVDSGSVGEFSEAALNCLRFLFRAFIYLKEDFHAANDFSHSRRALLFSHLA